MSLIVSLYVREGIVMASDSRITLNTETQGPHNVIQNMAVVQSDSTYKLFLAPAGVGIATCGNASIDGVPISGYIESFIRENLGRGDLEVDQVPERISNYFNGFSPVPDVTFHVAGYKKVDGICEQHVWQVIVRENACIRVNSGLDQGATWGGEFDVLSRIIKQTTFQDSHGKHQPFKTYDIPYPFFTLQDAIDFSIYAIRTTIDTIRFQTRPKTVGGPVDVLVIKPEEAFWVQRKQLSGRQ